MLKVDNVQKRRSLISQISGYRSYHNKTAISVFIGEIIIYFTLFALVLFVDNYAVKIIFSIMMGLWTGRLFVIGHDACHGSYTDHPRLNKIIGYIGFLPSLTFYKAWRYQHNMLHHVYTNYTVYDLVWQPLSKPDYDKLRADKKLLYRLYRSPFGFGLYYIHMTILNFKFMNSNISSKGFARDLSIMFLYVAVWGMLIYLASFYLNQNIFLMYLLGMVLPLMIWVHIIGFVVYVHHTHLKVQWYNTYEDWKENFSTLTDTVHIIFPYGINKFMKSIMEHNAHHLDMKIPLYTLPAAQANLEASDDVLVQKFSWKWYLHTVKNCKLYDFDNKCWLRFDGAPAAPSGHIS